ncbi:hydrolase [Sodiomyces alkalinus F11]|uniref:Hydrolase n=1 Tax=Sodiomyces alkalinus (strain CBS 110278 / VKM F-3762 / F11) TaxID=1314773 RepID=A0A3N2Q4G4_SODAK|nr:hydrolase [Sodiomyces alkalinus F11]ROT41606.1 hydrolase [Sodiomyces alkalinus F11]
MAQSNETEGLLPLCRDVVFPVKAVKSIEGEFSLENYDLNVLFGWASREVLRDGEYEISARLCEPASGIERKEMLQLLIHGATFNKVMWDFPYKPETYSWTRFMTAAGYTTLAIDLVGNGNSSKPDGLFEAQTGTFIQTVHQVIETIRADETALGRTFDKIAIVGFSIGAIVANSIADRYPSDADAIVLLGITWDLAWIYPAFLTGMQTAANLVDPERWGDLDGWYQTQPTRATRRLACFAGDFEEGAVQTDFETRDIDTFGTAVTFTYHLVTAPQYVGPVFLGLGKDDSTFCPRTCGIEPYKVYTQFPKAKEHMVKVYPNTGHALMYHRVAPVLFADCREFLDAF